MKALTLRVVVAEDEAMAREKLVRWVEDEADLTLVGQAADGPTAVEAIDRTAPDLLFLDVQMPGLSGLEVLARVRHVPFVVLTTAFDQYAVAAFDAEAVDYLLKPFGPTRFHQALDRVRRRHAGGFAHTESPSSFTTLFSVQGGRVVTVPVADVSHFEARDDYVAAWTPAGRRLLAVRLGTLVDQLDPNEFVQVHRSHIVRVDRIVEATRLGSGRYRLKLAGGRTVDTSRAGGRRLRERGAWSQARRLP